MDILGCDGTPDADLWHVKLAIAVVFSSELSREAAGLIKLTTEPCPWAIYECYCCCCWPRFTLGPNGDQGLH